MWKKNVRDPNIIKTDRDSRVIRLDLLTRRDPDASPIPSRLRQLNAFEMRIILFNRICKISLIRLIAIRVCIV